MKATTVCVIVSLVSGAQSAAAQTRARAGLDYPRTAVRVVEELAAGQYSAVVATFDETLARDFPADKLSAQWKELQAQAGSFLGVNATTVSPESGGYEVVVITCAFERAPENDVAVTFDRAGHIAGLYFGPKATEAADQWTPPGYAVMERFHEVPVTVEDGPWRLPATLTLPNGKGPFPALVLVPGSPPVDQDVTVGPNKIFKDIAFGLATRGVAVLRYTKRTHQFGSGLGGGNISSFSIREDLADDAHAAVALLGRRNEIDHQRTYVLGHSLGGLVVPRIARDNPQVAGIILMGAPSGDALTLLLKRSESAASLGGEGGKMASASIPLFKQLQSGALARGEVIELFGEKTPVSYWLDLHAYEAGTATARLKTPAMILIAGHDAEVLPGDVEAWHVALANKKNATFRFYPDLFHLFMPSTATQQGADSPADWDRPAHVTAQVVDDLASWILSNDKR